MKLNKGHKSAFKIDHAASAGSRWKGQLDRFNNEAEIHLLLEASLIIRPSSCLGRLKCPQKYHFPWMWRWISYHAFKWSCLRLWFWEYASVPPASHCHIEDCFLKRQAVITVSSIAASVTWSIFRHQMPCCRCGCGPALWPSILSFGGYLRQAFGDNKFCRHVCNSRSDNEAEYRGTYTGDMHASNFKSTKYTK